MDSKPERLPAKIRSSVQWRTPGKVVIFFVSAMHKTLLGNIRRKLIYLISALVAFTVIQEDVEWIRWKKKHPNNDRTDKETSRESGVSSMQHLATKTGVTVGTSEGARNTVDCYEGGDIPSHVSKQKGNRVWWKGWGQRQRFGNDHWPAERKRWEVSLFAGSEPARHSKKRAGKGRVRLMEALKATNLALPGDLRYLESRFYTWARAAF